MTIEHRLNPSKNACNCRRFVYRDRPPHPW